MATLSIPTTSALDPSELVPATHPAVFKTLLRLSRPSLISLVLDWLDERNEEHIHPYLHEDGDEQDIYPPAPSLPSLREIYTELQTRKGTKRDIVDRIIEGDWRGGLTLYQLAMADMQYLYEHPVSQKWTALKVANLSSGSKSTSSIPRFHPSTFLRNLQQEVLPDVKAHYNLDRHATLPLLILRIFVLESPYNTSLAVTLQPKNRLAFDSSKVFYIAFPDFSPYIYISLAAPPTTTSSAPAPRVDNKSLRRLILEGISKAFSKPRERYKLEATNLTARNLQALVDNRAGGRTNAASGGWGLYAEEKKECDNPLDTHLLTPETSVDLVSEVLKRDSGLKRKREEDIRVVERRKQVARGRFGRSAKADDGKGIERLDVRIDGAFGDGMSSDGVSEENLPGTPSRHRRSGRRTTLDLSLVAEENAIEASGFVWKPDIRITFHGQHVFAGIRELVEDGIVDGEKMPGWMTGEEGVSLGVIRQGRVYGFKGSGM